MSVVATGIKSECDAMLKIVGWEDARSRVVFKIRPFVGSIPYHRLCHASAVYSLLVFVVDRQNKNSPIARWLWVRASCATIIGSVRSSLDPIPVSQYLPQITIT